MDVALEDFLRDWAKKNMPSLTWNEDAFTAVLLMIHEVLRRSPRAEREATTCRLLCS